MGTLGQYLRDAREARGIDLRDAAQQTRISLNYLAALEKEDFARLPGEVFVKGFLKNYGKFLHLDEAEVIKRYNELRAPLPGPVVAAAEQEPAADVSEPKATRGYPIEPFLWGAGIVIVLFLLLFTALPGRHVRETGHDAVQSPAGQLEPVPVPAPAPDKLYLEVIALENTWVLIRTDASPQKNAVLKQGESLIWSADERFLISYGSAGAVKLLLNGQELTVNEPKNAVVRDLAITAAGVVSRNIQPEKPARPKRQLSSQQTSTTKQPDANAQRPAETTQQQEPPAVPPAPQKPWVEPPVAPTVVPE